MSVFKRGRSRDRDSAREITESEEVQPAAKDETPSETRQKVTSAIDDLLDEIDAVLEENTEELVASYKQRGGQ